MQTKLCYIHPKLLHHERNDNTLLLLKLKLFFSYTTRLRSLMHKKERGIFFYSDTMFCMVVQTAFIKTQNVIFLNSIG